MNKKLFNATIASVMAIGAIAVAAPPAQAAYFKDLPKDPETAAAIQKMAEFGLISGYADNTFRPNEPITRAQAAEYIYKVLQLEMDKSNPLSFSDVKKSDWFYPYIVTLAEYGFMNAVSAKKFEPNRVLTRGEMATLVKRAFNLNRDSDTLPFKDVPTTEIAYDVGALYDVGITKGISNTLFGINEPVTRGQMVLYIARTGVLENFVPKIKVGKKISVQDLVLPKGKMKHDAFVQFISHIDYTYMRDFIFLGQPEFDYYKTWEYKNYIDQPIVIEIKKMDSKTGKDYIVYLTITETNDGTRQYEFTKGNPIKEELNKLKGPKQLADYLKKKYKITDKMLRNGDYSISTTYGIDLRGHRDLPSYYTGNFEFVIPFRTTGAHFSRIYNKVGTVLEYTRFDVKITPNGLYDFEFVPLQKLAANIPLTDTAYYDLNFYKDPNQKDIYFIKLKHEANGNKTAILYGDKNSKLSDGQTYYLEATYFDQKKMQDVTTTTKYKYNSKKAKFVKM